jgi:uncharacterized Zn finger protein
LIEIDESFLVRQGGAGAFGRGLRCFEEDCVRDVVTTETATNAIVQDGRRYTVRLRHTHRIIEGECDCEVSDGIEFCQHCVAVALHLQEQQTRAMSIDKRSALRQIRRYLSQLSHEELLEEFLETIKQDRSLRNDLLQQARLSSQTLSYSELKTIIDGAGAVDHLYEPREIRAYFHGMESMLARLTEIEDTLDPLVLLRAVEHAIRRLNVDLELIDYAGEHPELCMDMLIDLHRVAVGRLKWTASELGSYLIDRGITESWHPFGALTGLYGEDLGNAFQEAALTEIESRCSTLEKKAVAGIDPTPALCDLAQLKENLSAGYNP